jgi:hypothetical protein
VGLFNDNRLKVKRVFEQVWRKLAQEASEKGFLYAPKAKLEIKMSLWLWESEKKTSAKLMLTSSQKFALDSKCGLESLEKRQSVWDHMLSTSEESIEPIDSDG